MGWPWGPCSNKPSMCLRFLRRYWSCCLMPLRRTLAVGHFCLAMARYALRAFCRLVEWYIFGSFASLSMAGSDRAQRERPPSTHRRSSCSLPGAEFGLQAMRTMAFVGELIPVLPFPDSLVLLGKTHLLTITLGLDLSTQLWCCTGLWMDNHGVMLPPGFV